MDREQVSPGTTRSLRSQGVVDVGLLQRSVERLEYRTENEDGYSASSGAEWVMSHFVALR
jgi:hypothetical protein